MDKIKKIYLDSCFLVFFKYLKNDCVIKNYLYFLKNLINSDNFEDTIESYSSFVSSLYDSGKTNLGLYLKEKIQKNKNIEDNFQIKKELDILSGFLDISFSEIKFELEKKFAPEKDFLENLAFFEIKKMDLKLEGFCRSEDESDIFKNNRAFIFDNDFEIKPVEIVENIKFSNLIGYEEQKKILLSNTNALLSGLKVNNILLYGDAGCGKSTSVRALLGEFSELKIIQIFKNNLVNLDKLYKKLSSIPYKFIIFADDISFDESDETLSSMKAVLEGSLIQCPKNAAIYATSNRRHLIRESFQSRKGSEIHLSDTINEVSSLSERFGINLLYERPSNEDFIKIVIALAREAGIKMDEKYLTEKAQRLALIKGSRSPRIARQLIDNLLAQVGV